MIFKVKSTFYVKVSVAGILAQIGSSVNIYHHWFVMPIIGNAIIKNFNMSGLFGIVYKYDKPKGET